MSELHTYRFPFRNGSVFKTNAESEKKALRNFRTTFTDSQILEKGGTAFPFHLGRKKEYQPIHFFTITEALAITGTSRNCLSHWEDVGIIKRFEGTTYDLDNIRRMQELMSMRRRYPGNYIQRAKERWMTGR